MTPRRTAEFRMRWPRWFAAVSVGIGDGWAPILWQLCEAIERAGTPDNFRVIQVKEKFGALRVYAEGTTPAITALIHAAQAESARTAEAGDAR